MIVAVMVSLCYVAMLCDCGLYPSTPSAFLHPPVACIQVLPVVTHMYTCMLYPVFTNIPAPVACI